MANPYFTDFRTGGLLQDNIPTQSVAPTGILQEPMPNYDVNLQPFGDLAKNLAVSTYESASIPRNTLRDIFSGTPISREKMMGDVTQFGFDFGMLPALAVGAFANPSRNALMSAGGVDTVSGGSPRGFDVDELGFYSKALEEAKRLPQAKGTGEQFRKMLLSSGVKPDEIKFTPELEGLLSQPKVTREELVGLLEDNRIRPTQTTKFSNSETPEYEGMNFRDTETLDVYDSYGQDYVNEEIRYLIDDSPEEVVEAMSRLSKTASEEDLQKIQKALVEEKNIDLLIDSDSELSINNPNIINEIEDVTEMLVSERYSYDPILRVESETGYEIVGSDDTGYQIRREDGTVLESIPYNLNEARIQAENDALDRGVIGFEDYEFGETRFFDSTESGGSNYQERLLQIPSYEGYKEDFIATGHFNEPNIAVHARTKDREMFISDPNVSNPNEIKDQITDAPVLYVEELQSDWGQRGRKQGFDTPENKKKLDDLLIEEEKALNERNALLPDANKVVSDLGAKIAEEIGGEVVPVSSYGEGRFTIQKNGTFIMDDNSVRMAALMPRDILDYSRRGERAVFDTRKILSKEQNQTISKFTQLDKDLVGIRDVLSDFTADIQFAPFVASSEKFTELGIKRVITEAVNEGKDFVVFSSGDIQYDRWGDEGLKTFYDKIIPKVGKKVSKKLDPDAFSGTTYVDDTAPENQSIRGEVAGDRFVIEITPKMREAVQKGQPLFTAPTVPVPSTGLFADDPKDLEEYYSRGIF
jgi:hypothetical protein